MATATSTAWSWGDLGTWLKRRLTPLAWAQENFHHGQQLLAVWRWGRCTWEVWDWGPNTGSDDVHQALKWLTGRKAYTRIRTRAQLRLITSDWRVAKGLV